jgi:putative flippase GtrA
MHSGFWFVLVGASAALTHMAVFAFVVFLAPTLWPEIANVAGFLVAFAGNMNQSSGLCLSFLLQWVHSVK